MQIRLTHLQTIGVPAMPMKLLAAEWVRCRSSWDLSVSTLLAQLKTCQKLTVISRRGLAACESEWLLIPAPVTRILGYRPVHVHQVSGIRSWQRAGRTTSRVRLTGSFTLRDNIGGDPWTRLRRRYRPVRRR